MTYAEGLPPSQVPGTCWLLNCLSSLGCRMNQHCLPSASSPPCLASVSLGAYRPHFTERKRRRNRDCVCRGKFLEDCQRESSGWSDIHLRAGAHSRAQALPLSPAAPTRYLTSPPCNPKCSFIHHWPLSGTHSPFPPPPPA